MDKFIAALKAHIAHNPPNFGDGESVLTLLYEAYNEVNPMDDPQIKADFHRLYELMNGMPLQDMDKIIYPVCTLCREHERSGFVHGVQVGVALSSELESFITSSNSINE